MDAPAVQQAQKWLHKVAIVLLIIGGLNWGLVGTFRVNLVERLFGKAGFQRLIQILVGIAALSLAFNRDNYLPFLGESVFPCAVLNDQIPAGATRSIQVRVEPGAKVVQWATEPTDGQGIVSQDKAQRDYANAGVTTADETGLATLKVREPQPYKVPVRGRLEQHIHFRVCGPTGFVGRIKTIFLADGRVEGFTNGQM